MKTIILICLGALLGVAAAVNRLELPTAKVTVQVLDEDRKPVSGATVRFGFRERLAANEDVFIVGQTNVEGLFTGEGGCDPSGIGLDINKRGYYQGGAPIPKFSKVDPLTNHWQPWDETYTTVLRPLGKPVPLCAKWLRKLDIPVLDQACGYDLEKGDWVAPWGQGDHADFIFQAKRDYRDYFNFTVEVELTFSQPTDGLVRTSWPEVGRYSTFHWERMAPEAGYAAPHHIRFVNRDPRSVERPEQSFDDRAENKGYFFRVRTVEQNGRIVAANYGKITGDIGIDARDTKTCYVYFTYYFNPASMDRNLEWDTKRNLISGLSWEETPREP